MKFNLKNTTENRQIGLSVLSVIFQVIWLLQVEAWSSILVFALILNFVLISVLAVMLLKQKRLNLLTHLTTINLIVISGLMTDMNGWVIFSLIGMLITNYVYLLEIEDMLK